MISGLKATFQGRKGLSMLVTPDSTAASVCCSGTSWPSLSESSTSLEAANITFTKAEDFDKMGNHRSRYFRPKECGKNETDVENIKSMISAFSPALFILIVVTFAILLDDRMHACNASHISRTPLPVTASLLFVVTFFFIASNFCISPLSNLMDWRSSS